MCTATGGGLGGLFTEARSRAKIAQKATAAQPVGKPVQDTGAPAEPAPQATGIGGTPRPLTGLGPTGIQIQPIRR